MIKDKLEISEEVQFFVYELFRGSLIPELTVEENRFEKDTLLLIIEMFVNHLAVDKLDDLRSELSYQRVSDYIVNNEKVGNEFSDMSIWKGISEVLDKFINNSFEHPVSYDYFDDLRGCGTDAVPIISTWLNVIEIDDNYNVLNWEESMIRANERALLYFDRKEPDVAFREEELHQEVW